MRSRSSGSARRTGSSGSRAFEDAAEAPVRRAPRLRRTRLSAQRGALVHRAAGSRTCRCRGRSCSWGMRLPWDPSQRMYVWFDALLNYYTALSFAREGEDLTERYWPATAHVLGKDILKFHAVIWPALCSRPGSSRRSGMVIHGFLLMGEKKMSKSLGNVLDPNEVIDALRRRRAALLLHARGLIRPGRQPSRPAGFEARYETELANDWGNLASRTLAMIERYRDGVVPDGRARPGARGRRRRARRRSTRSSSELLDRRRADPGAGGDLGAGAAAQPLRRGVAALGPRQGGVRRPSGLDSRALQPRRGDPGARAAAARLHAGDERQGARGAGRERARLDSFGARGGGARVERIPPLFPKLEAV